MVDATPSVAVGARTSPEFEVMVVYSVTVAVPWGWCLAARLCILRLTRRPCERAGNSSRFGVAEAERPVATRIAREVMVEKCIFLDWLD